jgi:hypothetical protein
MRAAFGVPVAYVMFSFARSIFLVNSLHPSGQLFSMRRRGNEIRRAGYCK